MAPGELIEPGLIEPGLMDPGFIEPDDIPELIEPDFIVSCIMPLPPIMARCACIAIAELRQTNEPDLVLP